jgi:hypothetical protein
LKCIFCKQDSSNSISVEHVIPESLGNKKTVLPKGAVCDSCNNYFASKIEQPVLASGEFTQLRFNQLLKNKNGSAPETKIVICPHAVIARRNGKLSFSLRPEAFEKIQKYLSTTKEGMIAIPVSGDLLHYEQDTYHPEYL